MKLAGHLERTDTDIAQAVRQALEWHVLVPHDCIRSTVSNGWVTLEGTVSTWSEREDAEGAVQNLAGVRGVTDNMTVVPAEKFVHPETIRDAIEGALERRAEREAKRIRVEVMANGIVALSGSVRIIGREASGARGRSASRRVSGWWRTTWRSISTYESRGRVDMRSLEGRHVLMVIAPADFRDEELLEP